jgi:CBS domain-containing protein
MNARDIMTADPFCVTPIDTVRRAADVMRELDVGAVPVVDEILNPVLRGIITDRDITVRCVAEGHAPSCLVRDHMTPAPLQTVRPEADVAEVIQMMEKAQVRRIPVVNPDGTLAGIIAQADIALKLGPTYPGSIEELLERISAASVPLT